MENLVETVLEKDNSIVYTYRYMWKKKDDDHFNFKIVSDVSDGLVSFQNALISELGDDYLVVREYLHEYNIYKIGKIESINEFDSEDKNNEKV